jgi:excisionase family DNA binding protein
MTEQNGSANHRRGNSKSLIHNSMDKNTELLTTRATSKFITRVELANELKVSPSTIYNWTRWNWIPSHKMGGRLVRYKLDEVLKALEGVAP